MTNKYEKPRDGKEYRTKLPKGIHGDLRIDTTSTGVDVYVGGGRVYTFFEVHKCMSENYTDGPWFKDLNRMCDEYDKKKVQDRIDANEALKNYKPYYKD